MEVGLEVMERGGMGRAERWEGKGREEKGREGGREV